MRKSIFSWPLAVGGVPPAQTVPARQCHAERFGGHLRVRGRLLPSRRGLLLETADGSVWALDLTGGIAAEPGFEATVEGVRAGLDRILVQWIAPVPEDAPSGRSRA